MPAGLPWDKRQSHASPRATGCFHFRALGGSGVTSNRALEPGKLTQRGRPDPCVLFTEGWCKRAIGEAEYPRDPRASAWRC
jgi:hypothetical protein